MVRPVDITGQKFGRLTALYVSGRHKTALVWRCICECGEHTDAVGVRLRNGTVKSCGCLHIEAVTQNGKNNRTHGHRADYTSTPIYNTYRSMLERTANPNNPAFHNYGGRGISVCDRWQFGEKGKDGFECFAEDMGHRPDGMSIERVDVNGNYEPLNCVWANDFAQMQNTRFNVVSRASVDAMRLLADNENIRAAELGRMFGLSTANASRIIKRERWGEAA